jgi:hypothetical protein
MEKAMKEISILSKFSDSGRVKARKKTKEGAPESYFFKAGSSKLSIRVEPRVYLVPVIFLAGTGFFIFRKRKQGGRI